MPRIEWAEFLELGEPSIDAQHKRLVGIVNVFLDAADRGAAQDVLQRTLDDLLDYTNTHFDEEEAFMERVGHRGLAAHRREHDTLRREVAERLTGLVENKGSILEMQAFLTSWIVGHVMGWDGMISAHRGKAD